MNITQRDGEGFSILALEGRLTAAVAPQLRQVAEELIAAGRTRLVVDLADVAFIDSSGLGALVGALKTARGAGGDLRIAAAPAQVLQVLRLTNLDRVLQVHESAEDAFNA